MLWWWIEASEGQEASSSSSSFPSSFSLRAASGLWQRVNHNHFKFSNIVNCSPLTSSWFLGCSGSTASSLPYSSVFSRKIRRSWRAIYSKFVHFLVGTAHELQRANIPRLTACAARAEESPSEAPHGDRETETLVQRLWAGSLLCWNSGATRKTVLFFVYNIENKLWI